MAEYNNGFFLCSKESPQSFCSVMSPPASCSLKLSWQYGAIRLLKKHINPDDQNVQECSSHSKCNFIIGVLALKSRI